MAITDTNGIYYASGQPYYDKFMTNWFLMNFPDALNTSSTLIERLKRRPVNSVAGRATIWPVIYGKDAGQGKATFLSVLGIERAKLQSRALVDQAIAHLGHFGSEADLLRQIARFTIERDK